MKGLIKILIGTLIVLVTIILIIVGAMKLYFTEERIIALVSPPIEKAINRNIDIKRAEFSILKGFVLSDITIKEEDVKNNFVTIKEFSISYELWPLLEKKLTINSVSLVSPSIHIVRYKNGSFNYESILPKNNSKSATGTRSPQRSAAPGPAGATGALPLAITVNNVSISGGQVSFRDEIRELPSVKAVIDLETDLDISPSGAINYKGEMALDAKTTLGKLPTNVKSHFKFDTSKISLKGDLWLDKWLVNLAGRVTDYMELPNIVFNISSEKLDLDDIRLKVAPFLEQSQKHSKGSTPGGTETRSGPPIPLPPMMQNMEAKGTVEIGELIYSNLPLKAVKVNCLLKDGKMTIKKEIGDLCGGRLVTNLNANLNEKSLPFKGNLTVERVEIGGLMNLVAPKLMGIIVGDVHTRLSFSGSGFPSDAVKNNLILKGTYGMKDGKIMRNPITIAISRLLNMKELEEPSFESVDGDINLEKGWVFFKSLYSSKDMKVKVENGRVSLDGALNVPMVIRLSKELSRRLVARQSAMKVLLNDNGIAELPITLKGSWRHPSPTINMKKAKNQLIKGVLKGVFGQ